MSEPYRSATLTHLNPETKGLPIAREEANGRTTAEFAELPVRLRASTSVSGSRPAYYRVGARSWYHLVDWASQRTNFDASQDFFRYQDEHGLDVFLTDESDFAEAIVALDSIQRSRNHPKFDRDPPSVPSTSPPSPKQQQPPSPRGDRLELWIVKKEHTVEFVYRRAQSIKDIAQFVNESSPSNIQRIHGFMEFRPSRRLPPNLLISPETVAENTAMSFESSDDNRLEPATTSSTLHYSDDERMNVSLSRSPSPIMITTEVGVTRQLDVVVDDHKDEESIVYHVWVPPDESGQKYRFRVGSFEAQFASKEHTDFVHFPQLCFGMIPSRLRHVFGRMTNGATARDLCLFIEQVSGSDIGRGDVASGIIAGYGARDDFLDDLLSRVPEVESDGIPFARRIVSAPPQSVYQQPPKMGKLPSSSSVFHDRGPVFK